MKIEAARACNSVNCKIFAEHNFCVFYLKYFLIINNNSISNNCNYISYNINNNYFAYFYYYFLNFKLRT